MNKKENFASLIKNHTDKCKEIILLEETSSTNLVAKEYAAKGADEYTVVISKKQTSGRGRMGRSFFSPDGGIYMSVILRPQMSADKSLLITTAAADAVCGAINGVFGLDCGIKWVNDIILDGKKVCGILTEAALDTESGGLKFAIVGIGINLYPSADGFPEELSSIAGTLSDAPCDADKRARLVGEIINRLYENYSDLESRNFAERYKNKIIGIGKEITVIKPDGNRKATALSIDDDMRLCVQYPDGTKEALSSGEVSTRL